MRILRAAALLLLLVLSSTARGQIAPTIESFSVTPSAFDTSQGPVEVAACLRVYSGSSGLAVIDIETAPPSALDIYFFNWGPERPLPPGAIFDGYTFDGCFPLTLPPEMAQGVYSVSVRVVNWETAMTEHDGGSVFNVNPEVCAVELTSCMQASAVCEANLGSASADLAQCSSELATLQDLTVDQDEDGVFDQSDACPASPSGVVDSSGCTRSQFCAAVDATTTIGRRTCKHSDWENDEPVMRSFDRDCEVDRNAIGSADDRCVPAVP